MQAATDSFDELLGQVRACTRCLPHLPHGVRPVVQAHPEARILIVGQAPGRRVHASGIPFDDPSGDRLRAWMSIDSPTFYDPTRIAILPMSFCYPGTGTSGDLPPRPECAPAWRDALESQLDRIELTLLVGQYAQAHHPDVGAGSVTRTVRAWKEYVPRLLPLPHPSPRNNRWLHRNPWFEQEVLPWLRIRVHELTTDYQAL